MNGLKSFGLCQGSCRERERLCGDLNAIGRKKRSPIDEEFPEAPGVGPVWPALILAAPVALMAAAYKFWVGGGFFGVLGYYTFFGLCAFFVALFWRDVIRLISVFWGG